MAGEVEEQEAPQSTDLGAFFDDEPSASSPAVQEEVVEEPKTDEPVEEAPKEPVAEEEPKEAPKQEPVPGQPEVDLKTEEESAKWDSDDNPYKKIVTDTRGWANRLNQELLQLKKGQDILGKKVDGTYDPETEQADAAVSPEALVLQGKVAASEELVRGQFGNEYVDKTLAEFDATFGANQAVQARVLGAAAPVAEAIKIMREREFQSKYGSDPDAIKDTIRKELEAELRTTIAKEEAAKIAKRLQRKEDQPTGLSEVRHAGGQDSEPKGPGVAPLAELFG